MKSNYLQAIQALTSILQEQESALAVTQSDNASLREQVDLLRLELIRHCPYLAGAINRLTTRVGHT